MSLLRALLVWSAHCNNILWCKHTNINGNTNTSTSHSHARPLCIGKRQAITVIDAEAKLSDCLSLAASIVKSSRHNLQQWWGYSCNSDSVFSLWRTVNQEQRWGESSCWGGFVSAVSQKAWLAHCLDIVTGALTALWLLIDVCTTSQQTTYINLQTDCKGIFTFCFYTVFSGIGFHVLSLSVCICGMYLAEAPLFDATID